MRSFIVYLLLACVCAFASESMFGNSGTKSLVLGEGTSTRGAASLTPMYAEMAVDSNYVLGPGDFLDLMLEDKYLSIQVYPDGNVAVEECGAVHVGGKTFGEAQKMILDLVSKRYKREFCFVQLAALKKFRVNAMGAVGLVGQHIVDPQTRLSQFIRAIGNPLANANTEDVQVIRGKDTIHVNYTTMTTNGEFENDVMLEQGDKIFVPFVPMGDNVTLLFPGYRTSVAYRPERTLADYFDLAGANRMHNFGYKSVCVREPDKDPRWITLAEMKTTTVEPNTEIEFFVKELFVYVGGALNFIGRYNYNPTWHAIDYIASSGVNTVTGNWNQVKVWRGKKPEATSINVASDPILPGDFIELPKSHYESFKDFTIFMASLLSVISTVFIIYTTNK
ncbi:sugar transporter [Fibrobacter sp. UWB2]|jgi:protein involved in polysaccharide export with SLBB domain|uniref:polysaccharide biosynthesis/export family protein n=1 Tax=Fibrobacter sp. UWB2 TaxID=1964358 RepID=UPI000B52357F|nr:polysaccharide biosynthesis/export family protein [Fibrobacter sp. UWB2]OWV23363.1 sugar transporter [Fibrobacter sp. UWB2]